MANFGAKYPVFAPFKGAEPTDTLPKYDTKTVLGKLVSANLTVNLSSGEQYADDEMCEQISEFASGTLAMETNDMTDEVAAIVYGATLDNESSELTYKGADAIPMGGLAYYKVLQRNGTRMYKGYYYPKVKAALGNDSAQTKGNSITFGNTSTTFTIFEPNVGGWRITKEFTTESEAKTWVDTKLAATTTGG